MLEMDAKSILGHKISDFNTKETFKFRCISKGSDLTIYVKEFGLEKFKSSLKLNCIGKYGRCEAQSDETNTTVTFSPKILSPYLSFQLCPSNQFLPSIIGKYSCKLSTHILCAGNFKYFFGNFLPSINAGLSYKLNYFGSQIQTSFIPYDEKYNVNLYGDVYVTDEVYRASLSLDTKSFSETTIGLHLSNRSTYLGFYVDNKLSTTAHFFNEFKYSDTYFGLQTTLQKDIDGPLNKGASFGIKKPTQFGYYKVAVKTPNIISAKVKYLATDGYEVSGVLRVSNFQFDDPHLGVSVCVFPDNKNEINPKNLSNVYKLPSFHF